MSLIRSFRVAAVGAVAVLPWLGPLNSMAAVSPYEPDAWTRGNSAGTSYFGWDVMEQGASPALGFGRILDDATPDLGVGTTATGARIYQGANGVANPAPTVYGHRSGSSNYYSGFGDADFADDTVTATAPGGAGGYTTVVLQVLASLDNDVPDLAFSMTTSGWTQVKDLYGLLPGAAPGTNTTGIYWQEWTAPGGNLPFSIHMTSTQSSRGIDSFQVDTYWTGPNATVAAVNSRSFVGVPEPAALSLAAMGAVVLGVRRRRVK